MTEVVFRHNTDARVAVVRESHQHQVHTKRSGREALQIESNQAGRVFVRSGVDKGITVCQELDRHLVRAHQPQREVVLAGVRGRQGNSAFQDWLLLNPSGTWDDFMAALGDGSVWQTTEW